MRKTIKVISEGLASNTFVYDESGNEIKGISKLTIVVVPDKPLKATIEFALPVELNIKAETIEELSLEEFLRGEGYG